MPSFLRAASMAAVLAAPLPALAHAVLIDSTPAPQGHVPAGTLAISFRYNSRIDAGRSKMTLSAAGGVLTRLAIHGDGPDRLAATAALIAGAYTLHWQVLAVDGHITRGNVPFTVDAPTTAAR